MSQRVLLQQQQHNNTMLVQIQNQKPMTAKFERNVSALSEICSEGDAKNLKKISNEVMERFNDLTKAFNERGEALSSLIEHSSQLGDRLSVFMNNLEMALGQLKSQEMASCRPPILRKQLAEADSIAQSTLQKEPIFLQLKQNAQEFIDSTNDLNASTGIIDHLN